MPVQEFVLRAIITAEDRLSQKIDAIEKKLVAMEQATKKSGSSLQRLEKFFKRVKEQAIGMFIGIGLYDTFYRLAAGVEESIRALAEFEAESVKLASLSAKAGQDINNLAQVFRAVASAASRDYAVSANQALNALEALVKAGLSGEEAMKALGGAIQMARLEGVEFQTAANNLVQVMAQFGIQGSEAIRVVDTLINASREGIGTANDFAKGLANCGASARNLGLGLEDTTTWLVVLERRFGSAQEAGTHLNRFFLELYEIAEKLGVPIRDANGALRNTNEVILDVIARARELGGDFKNLQDRLTGVDMRALKALSTFTQMTENFQELREEIGRQGSTWEAYKRWLETTQGRFAAMSAEVDRMKRRIGESASSIATYLGNVFLPTVETVFASWRGIVAHAVGDVAGNLESAIEVQMRLGRITEKEAGDWIKSWIDMGKITRQEALKIAEHLGIMEGGIRDLVYAAMETGEEVPEQFKTIVDSGKELEDQVKITAEAIVNLGKKFKLDADEAINLANKLLGLNLTWDEHDQLVKQLIQDYGLSEDQARQLVEAMAEEAEKAKRAEEAQKAHDEALKKLQNTLGNLANYGRVLGPFHDAIENINDAIATLGSQAPSNIQNLLSTLEELNNRFIELEEQSKAIGAAQKIAGAGMSYFTTIQEVQEALMADEIAMTEQRIEMTRKQLEALEKEASEYEKVPEALREKIEAVREELATEQERLNQLKQSTQLTVEQMLSQKRLAAIQQMLAFTSQVVSLQQTAMQLAMMGADNAANMFMNTSIALTKALEDGVITEQEMKDILEKLGVTFDEQGKPVINLKNIMEDFRKKMEETRNKVQDFRSTLESLDGLTVHTYHYHHEITVHGERGGGGGGGGGGATEEEAEWWETEYGMHHYQRGAWYVPRNMPAYLHRGEMVLPRRIAEWFRRGGWLRLRGGAEGSKNVSVNAPVKIEVHGSVYGEDLENLSEEISRRIVRRLRVMS